MAKRIDHLTREKGKEESFLVDKRYTNKQRDSVEVDIATNPTTSTCQTPSTENVGVSSSNVAGTSRKKMRRDNQGPNYDLESEQHEKEYRLISLENLSTAVSKIHHICVEGMNSLS